MHTIISSAIGKKGTVMAVGRITSQQTVYRHVHAGIEIDTEHLRDSRLAVNHGQLWLSNPGLCGCTRRYLELLARAVEGKKNKI